jgi:hypothetical protein
MEEYEVKLETTKEEEEKKADKTKQFSAAKTASLVEVGPRQASRFEKILQVGEGTFG